jgi:ATP-dependent protease Clp ATPase subunit
MKNIFKTVALLFVIFFTFSSNVLAYELTEKDETIITKIDKKIFYLIDVKKKFTAEKIVNILDKYNKKKVKNKRLKEILNQVIEDVDYEYCI